MNNLALSNGLLVFLLTLVISMFVVYKSYQVSVDSLNTEIYSNMSRVVDMVSTIVDADLHRKFVADPSLENSPEYIRYQIAFSKILEVVGKDFSYIYSIVYNNGKYFYVLDSSPADHPNSMKLMDEYSDAPDILLEAYRKQIKAQTTEPYTDSMGTFITSYSPLKDETGQMYAMFAIDMEYAVYQEKIQPINNAAYTGIITSLIISFVLGVFVGVGKHLKSEIYKSKEFNILKLKGGKKKDVTD